MTTRIIPIATEDYLGEVLAETDIDPVVWQLIRLIESDDAGNFVAYRGFRYQVSLRSNVRKLFTSTSTYPVEGMDERTAEAAGGALAEDRAERYGETWDASYAARSSLGAFKALRAAMRLRGIAG